MKAALVAGVGNVLMQDDGFGVVVVQALAAGGGLPEGVECFEAGIGGLNLVQQLYDGYGALVIVDAADRGAAPGTIFELEPDVPDLARWPDAHRRSFLADMHMATPNRALALARALGVMPPVVRILGCQPLTCEPGLDLSAPVRAAVGPAIARVRAIVAALTTPTPVGQPAG